MKTIITLFLLSLNLQASLVCTLPAVCNLVSTINPGIRPLLIDPFSEETKNHPGTLLAPSAEMQPGIEQVIAHRENRGLKTLRLYLPSSLTKLYKIQSQTPTQALGQFWFYPDLSCGIAKQLKEVVKVPTKDFCRQAQKNQKEFVGLLRKIRQNSVFEQNEILAPYAVRYRIPVTMVNIVAVDFSLPTITLGESFWAPIEAAKIQVKGL